MESERLQNISQGINEAAQRGTMVQLVPLTARELLDHIEAQKRVIDVLQAANMQQATTVREALNRAEAAEAQLAAVPRQSIDALFCQQFGTYPIWFNETWTPIADWLGYKAARV